MAHPARQRLGQRIVMTLSDISEGRRAGATVQIFIPAADREIRPAPIEIDRHRADRMRQIPEDQRARRVRGFRELGHVEDLAGLVMRVGQEQQSDIPIERFCHPVAFGQAALGEALLFEAFDHIEVGREIARLAQHHFAAGLHCQRRRDQLEEVHADRIAGDHLVRCGPDQRRDLAADALRHHDPVGGVPAADKIAAPFMRDHFGDAGRRVLGQAAQGIAVEIDRVVGQDEAVAIARQRIGGVELSCAVEHQASSLKMARHRPASPPATFSGRAISS